MNKKIVAKKSAFVLIAILAYALSACAASGPSTKLNFTLTDFAFSPNEFTVLAGEEITLYIADGGTMEHDFIVMKYGMDAGDMFDEEDQPNVYWEMELQPGDSKTNVFTAPEQPGTYQILCGMPGHLQSGMVGKLIVIDQE